MKCIFNTIYLSTLIAVITSCCFFPHCFYFFLAFLFVVTIATVVVLPSSFFHFFGFKPHHAEILYQPY